MKDLYIVQKYIMAESAEEAIKKDKKHKVNEVFIDGDWKKNKIEKIIDKEIVEPNGKYY